MSECERCGAPILPVPGGVIEAWRVDGPKAPTSLPVHTEDRCTILRAFMARERGSIT